MVWTRENKLLMWLHLKLKLLTWLWMRHAKIKSPPGQKWHFDFFYDVIKHNSQPVSSLLPLRHLQFTSALRDKEKATCMNVRGIWNCDITKRQTHLGKLSTRKHFKSIFDSGSVKFSVSAISKEQCGCGSSDPAGEVEHNTEHYHERVHHTPPPVQTQYATIIHKHSNTPQSHAFHHNHPLTVRNIHLNKLFNIKSVSCTGLYFLKQMKNVSKCHIFILSNQRIISIS